MCLLPRKVRVTSSCNLSPPWDSCCGSHKCYSLDHLREFLVPHATYGGYVILLSTLDAICHFLKLLLVTLEECHQFQFLSTCSSKFSLGRGHVRPPKGACFVLCCSHYNINKPPASIAQSTSATHHITHFITDGERNIKFVVATHSNTLMVYDNVTLEWTAQVSHPPVAVRTATFG